MKNELTDKINKLKKERKAVILVHNYQPGEVQDIADHRGDSLELSRIASRTDAQVVVFCGVSFMAETASILCPDKTVLMPEITAGCPMADMVTPAELLALKEKHPQAAVVAYVNTSAEIKALADVCCTSANSIKIVNSLPPDQEIIFVPDKYLADYTIRQTKRDNIIPWNGYCPSHVKILPEDIEKQKKLHPGAKAMAHPECPPAVLALCDAVCSTSGMLKFAKETDAREIIVGTEVGMIYRLQKDNPNKIFYPAAERALCPTMKISTLEKILWSLEDMKHEVRVSADIRARAKKAVDRMLAT